MCDGFIGNIALKISEGLAQHIVEVLKKALKSPGFAIWLRAVAGRIQGFRRRRSITPKYGGAPLLGVRGIIVIGHGRSNPTAIKNAIRVAAEFGARSNERKD